MGNVLSSVPRRDHVTGESEVMAAEGDNVENEVFHDTIDETGDQEARSKAKETEMEEFKKQLQVKREQRREILDRHKAEKKELEVSLDKERKAKLEAYESNKTLRELLIQNNIEIPENLQSSKEYSDITETLENMKEEFEKLRTNNTKLRKDLAKSNSALQAACSDIADLQGQNIESMKQISALKEVVSVSKTLLQLREQQLNELKDKLNEIERSLADREANMLSSDLRQEYERQLQNIRTLRTLYEERARLAEVTRQSLIRDLEEQKVLKQAEMNKVKELTEKVESLEARVDELQETISNKNNQIYTCQDETRGLKEEMSAVNKLFSQVLLGYKNQKDLDKLVHRLEENHGLLTHMAEKENDSEASSALPKLLLEIVSQVDEELDGKLSKSETPEEAKGDGSHTLQPDTSNSVNTTAEEIVQNLPKVWRVLMELLSHQTTTDDNTSEIEKFTTCYKTVETKSGPVQVPSVSQTYIRLKDLIVEKLSLIKEVNRMKQLNGHLETRLGEQERRLCLVTTELSKTWHVVGRLRRHHQQLHTHEKILKYELQQKRKLLNELKEELEYCREKWEQAREKNSQSERDWKKLRAEFSSRKAKSTASFNNSAESGYSDERPSDDSSESNDESEYVAEQLKRSKKKLKKSFETILDSSTDLHLAAEREDPASDMLDVADLPLDTQDGDDHQDVSDCCNSESLLKSEKLCEETEDEAGELVNDSCAEELCNADHSQPNELAELNKTDKEITSSSKIQEISIPVIDPAAILKSIKEQNERLVQKDKKLEKLENSSESLLRQTQGTVKKSNQLNETLDHLLDKPSSSKIVSEVEVKNTQSSLTNDENKLIIVSDKNKVSASSSSNQSSEIPNIDFKAILDNVQKQNERLAKKDKKLQKLEQDCAEVLNQLTNGISTNETGNNIIDSISNIESDSGSQDSVIETETANKQVTNVSDEGSPSTSSTECPTVDFKAILENVNRQNERLAKKDERLQILENGSAAVVKNLSETLNTGEEIIQKLDMLHETANLPNIPDENKVVERTNDTTESREGSEPSTSSELDHEARFAARDIRLKRLEEQTKSLVSKVNKTTTKGVKIHYKLQELHNIYGSENSRASTPSDEERNKQNDEDDNDPESQSQDNTEGNTE